MTLHDLLDHHYGPDGLATLQQYLADQPDLDARAGPLHETPLHVATRRRRYDAVALLLEAGAPINATTAGGKTAYAHARRRGFDEIVALLHVHGANLALNQADRLAVFLSEGALDHARTLLAEIPTTVHTGNPEEDRLLADLAGRNDPRPVALLIDAGAYLLAPGLDGGTPLHQAAWFGQPVNAGHLLAAGASVHILDTTHHSTPLGWAVHGSRHAGGAVERQTHYVVLAQMLLEAGSLLHHPGETEEGSYRQGLLQEASPAVRAVLESAP